MIKNTVCYVAAMLIVFVGLGSFKAFKAEDSIINLVFLILILLVSLPAFNFWYRLLKKI
jgi:hypothetical protein